LAKKNLQDTLKGIAMRNIVSRHRQGGAVIVTVALSMLFLLGFMGLALDFGRLFVVKTELQTAMDSCALAAAQELDGNATTAIARAHSAGKAAGNLNRVNMQSVNWSGQGQLIDAEITFKNAAYADTTKPADARYAQCQHTQPAIQMLLLHAMGAFSGNATDYPRTRNVAALAVATRASAQSTCPVPLALKPRSGGVAPNYGFTVGQWVTLITAASGSVNGQIGWANLDGSNNASQTKAEMNGYCGTKVGDQLGTPGTQTTIAEPWNYRFGIYKNLPTFSIDPAYTLPDFTGYAYTSANWPSANNAYSGTTGNNPPGTAANFISKRASFASCADQGTNLSGRTGVSCESITGLRLNSFKDVALPGNVLGGHKQYGSNRRIVTVPVISPTSSVIGYACMLMLQPLSIPMTDVQLEFLGNAGALNSPCASGGLPGGSAGPLVPVLVR
jgi:hypothetical protein